MSPVTLADIERAREAIQGKVRLTPLILSDTFTHACGAPIWLKAESLQLSGSFKVRGALNKMHALVSAGVALPGVICASAGNHAAGVALAAQLAGVRACIVMPLTTPLVKLERTRKYGARVLLHGESYDDAYREARRLADLEGLVFIHAYDDPAVVAGQGTIGLEILDAVRDVGTIVVPGGGGGLAAGIAVAVKSKRPGVRIVAVQAEASPGIRESFRSKRMLAVPPALTLADGIRVSGPGEVTFPLIRDYVDDVVTVSEEETAEAIVRLLEVSKLVVEASGAVPLAACLSGRVALDGRPVVLVLSGGNIDLNQMARIIESGLTKAGRYLVVRLPIPDRPGELHRVLGMLGERRVNLIEAIHYRAGWQVPVGWVEVELVLEVRDREHGNEILLWLQAAGYQAVQAGR